VKNLQYLIRWVPEGRLLEYALFYFLKEPTHENSSTGIIYGYRHWYEGGGCWSDTYFKITNASKQSTSRIFLCENPDDDELTDTAFKPTTPNSLEDKLCFQSINEHVSDWIEWSDENDCMVLRQAMQENLIKKTTDGEQDLACSVTSVEESDPIYLLIEEAFAK